ncbi:DUF2971 domain-containing protein [Aureimonas sp. SA4125]|uniref:DUF2971 domain-containing protein n=1 Tax=Aureimonas sp. SA4125 TaxID=2826993 RepID=UPI001CC36938|nr:DUF2971 domain-containing protein [Aureimonas sp. SA4125]
MEIRAIEEHYVFCPTYPEMNDAMEGLYDAAYGGNERHQYRRFVESVRHQKLSLGIAAFSESWDNELMWAHYADGFRGICIAYDVESLLDGLEDQTATLARMAYGEQPQTVEVSGRDEGEHARAILSTKSLKWVYEREWRLFVTSRGQAGYEPGAVRHVWLGARMQPDIKNRVQSRVELMNIEVHETRVDGYLVRKARR